MLIANNSLVIITKPCYTFMYIFVAKKKKITAYAVKFNQNFKCQLQTNKEIVPLFHCSINKCLLNLEENSSCKSIYLNKMKKGIVKA